MTRTDSFYNAANDTSALARSGFDRIWYEKCNAEHVQQTEGMWKVVTSEISAFLQHSPPVLSPLPEEACGVSEPFFEVSDVPWMSNLWHDGRGSNYLEWGPRSGSVHHADYYEIYSGPEPDPESITPVLWKTTTGRSGYYTAYHENYLYIRGCNENGCSALSYGVPVWPQG